MKALEPPDSHYLQAAMGWLELGNPIEAEHELDGINPVFRDHPDVLEVRWEISAHACHWNECVELANAVIRLAPGRASGWIDRAYSLRRLVRGGVRAAFHSLLPAVKRFPGEPLVPFNLSCYACQLGRLEEAAEWLGRAFTLAARTGEKKRLKLMAMDEPDLEPLWRRISQFAR